MNSKGDGSDDRNRPRREKRRGENTTCDARHQKSEPARQNDYRAGQNMGNSKCIISRRQPATKCAI